MRGQVFEDDPSITDAERLLRRIARSWVSWEEDGTPRISSAAFKDDELSVNLESVMAQAGRAPEEAIRDYSGYGLAGFTAAQARALNQALARDPLPEEPAHGIVYGPKKRGGIAQRLRDAALWVKAPPQTGTA